MEKYILTLFLTYIHIFTLNLIIFVIDIKLIILNSILKYQSQTHNFLTRIFSRFFQTQLY